MKFYYNDKLIRTSKNHTYTHAVINTETGSCVGCRTSKEACESLIRSEISRYNESIENAIDKIKSLEAGKAGHFVKDGRRKLYIKFDKNDSVEETEKWLASYKDSIEYINANYKVVELEAR